MAKVPGTLRRTLYLNLNYKMADGPTRLEVKREEEDMLVAWS